MTIFVWRTNRPRWLALLPLGLLALGLAAMLAKPALADIRLPAQPVATRSLEMLGYRVVQGDRRAVHLSVLVRSSNSGRDICGLATPGQDRPCISEVKARPYFNSQNANNWPPATLVDDG